MSDDLLGRVIAGRFRLELRLGAGGMGEVFEATDLEHNVRVALKLIRDTLAESKEAIARFEREVKATEALHHPNIVRFLAAGQDGAVRYLAMELLHGSTLKERIASRGAIPWRDTIPLVRGIVLALDAAHRAHLIHRDLKPENVFLAQDAPGAPPQVKLLDFGVARHTALPEGMTMTGTGIIVGTPGFVAPEVVLHGVADDPRSDLYGLGATWFEMLTGSKPFSAATPFALAMRHLSETPPRPSSLVPFSPIPEPLEALLARLLAKTPDERPASAAALLHELDALEDASLTPMPTAADPDAAAIAKTLTDMSTPRPAPPAPATATTATSTTNGPPPTTRKGMKSAARNAWLGLATFGVLGLLVFVSVDLERNEAPPTQLPGHGEPRGGDLDNPPPLLMDAGPEPTMPADAGLAAVDAGVFVEDAGTAAPHGQATTRRARKPRPPDLDVGPGPPK